MRILILGGTTEASCLSKRIAGRPDLSPILSFAGRTKNPARPPVAFRIGGFGGVDGLKAYLADGNIDAVVDATHPFAAQMSRNAEDACRGLPLPLAVFTRPPWVKQTGDRWTGAPTMAVAAHALGERPRRVFLTVGGLQLAAFAAAPQHDYLVRTIEPTDAIRELRSSRLIQARGPFALAAEIDLMREQRIDCLVTKNSGGAATAAKIEAARTLGIEIVVIERPPAGEAPVFHSVDEILNWIEHHRPAP